MVSPTPVWRPLPGCPSLMSIQRSLRPHIVRRSIAQRSAMAPAARPSPIAKATSPSPSAKISRPPRPKEPTYYGRPTEATPEPATSTTSNATPSTTATPATPTLPEAQPRKPDPQRGVEATMRVVKEGKLPPEYKPAERRITAIMVALPILLVTSWFLWQRVVLGKERKKVPGVGEKGVVREGVLGEIEGRRPEQVGEKPVVV